MESKETKTKNIVVNNNGNGRPYIVIGDVFYHHPDKRYDLYKLVESFGGVMVNDKDYPDCIYEVNDIVLQDLIIFLSIDKTNDGVNTFVKSII